MPEVAGAGAETIRMHGKKGNGLIPAAQEIEMEREQLTRGQAESNLYLTTDSDWIKV
jgi:hypothetical protein